MQGKIIENISNLYKIKTEKEIYEATARGKFKKEEITPVVGDNVEIAVLDENQKKAVIEKIEERSVYVKRPKLANISQIILSMLDKQLAFAEFLGINAVIVLNKTDLDTKQEFKETKSIYEAIGYKVIETNAKEQKGTEQLKEVLKGNINAFSGNSGVGKSTLINALFENVVTEEGEISTKNRRGKNTTTSTKLYEIDDNTFIADTPGFSTFEISEIESKNLANYFREFEPYIENCEFVGCTHIKEQNCGIKDAIKENKISEDRYNRFCKIYEELKQKEERKKW